PDIDDNVVRSRELVRIGLERRALFLVVAGEQVLQHNSRRELTSSDPLDASSDEVPRFVHAERTAEVHPYRGVDRSASQRSPDRRGLTKMSKPCFGAVREEAHVVRLLGSDRMEVSGDTLRLQAAQEWRERIGRPRLAAQQIGK